MSAFSGINRKYRLVEKKPKTMINSKKKSFGFATDSVKSSKKKEQIKQEDEEEIPISSSTKSNKDSDWLEPDQWNFADQNYDEDENAAFVTNPALTPKYKQVNSSHRKNKSHYYRKRRRNILFKKKKKKNKQYLYKKK